MKKNIIIAIATFFIAILAQPALGNNIAEIPTLWPEAATFSKKQMTRLDITDPSYEIRLENIRSISKGGPFARWKKVINHNLSS